MNKAFNAGKNAPKFRKLLVTTAISAAAGMLALGASPAKAENWADHTYEAGSASVDTSMANTTNITQHTYFLKARGDGNISNGWTVNVAQPSSTAKYVLYDTKGTPSTIRGNLNANGQIYIFNQSGVIFAPGSTINVGSIVASAGSIDDADIMNDDGRLTFKDMGTGAIALGGTMNVADAGLAAFVAPTVVNSGIINAKMGKVALAAGDKVTLDLYGDKLVEIAVDGKLADALVENSGAINAEGGYVSLTASAAKEAVDNVINMSGVVSVASATVKGGKIVLSGGDAGVVNVSGTADASGEGGGNINVTGQNILIDNSAKLLANGGQNGDGGNVAVIADNAALFRGSIEARGGANGGNGGFVETSGLGFIRLGGTVDTSAFGGLFGTWLIDPTTLTIRLGSGDSIAGANDGNTSNNQWIPTGTNTFGDAISEIYESEIENQDTNFVLRATKGITVTGDSADNTVQLKNNRSLTLETENNTGSNSPGTIDLTGSSDGSNLLFKTTGTGSITIRASTGTGTGNIVVGKLQTDNGDINISTDTGKITVKNLLKTTGSGDVTLDSGSDGITSFGSNFVIDAGGSVTLKDNVTTEGGLVDIDANNNVNTKGIGSNGNHINISADNTTTIDGAVDAGNGTVTLLTDGLALNGSVAGSSVSISRADDNGNISLGASNGGLEISQSELNKITTALLNIGTLGTASHDNSIIVQDADLTAFNKVVLNTKRGDSGSDEDVVFRGVNKSKALDVHADDDVVFDQTSQTTCNAGLLCLIGIGWSTTYTDASLDAQGNVNLYGNTNNLSAGDLRLEDSSTITTNGFNLYAESLNTRLDDGAAIDAEGGNITLKNVNTFHSDDADSIRTTGTGTITLYQNAGGSIQNAVSALNNTGAGLNTVNVGAGTYTENLTLDQANLKLDGATGTTVQAASAGNLVTVTASNVNIDPITFDGLNVATNGVNASGAGASGLVVDGNTFKNFLGAAVNVANGATTTKIINNTIFNVGKGVTVSSTAGLTIDKNIVYSTTGDAIDVAGSANAQITKNAIGYTDLAGTVSAGANNIGTGGSGGDGIFATGSNGVVIKGNKIASTVYNGPARKGSGILVTNTNDAVIGSTVSGEENVIKNVGSDGIVIRADGGTNNNNTIEGNKVTGAQRTGIYAEGATNGFIRKNVLKDGNLSGYGALTAYAGSGLTISGNDIDNNLGHGIHLIGVGGTNSVRDNDIDGTSQDGIHAEGTSNLTIGKNRIGVVNGADADGIYAAGGSGYLKIGASPAEANDVRSSGDDGIDVENTGAAVDVSYNKVTGTGLAVDQNGIEVSGTAGASITSNAVKNAGWDGINLQQSSGAQIKDNQIYDTKGASGIGIANGVSDTTVDGNVITKAKQYGMWIGGHTGTLAVTNNDVSDITQSDGIYVNGSTGAISINNNDVYKVGGTGIYGTGDIDEVNGNRVLRTGSHGILVANSAYVDIKSNKVGDAINGSNAATRLRTTNGSSISSANQSAAANNIGADGIHVENSGNAEIAGNTVKNTVNDGIFLDPSDDSVIAGNTVTSVGGDGIDSYGNSRVRIGGAGTDRNTISGTGLNGIRVEGGTDNLVQNNAVSNTGGNGIFVLNSDDVEVGGASSGLGNEITGAGAHGIFVSGGESALIQNNKVTGGAPTLGFFVLNDGVSGAKLDGIHVENNDGVQILNNTIAAGQGFSYTFGWPLYLTVSADGGNGADGHGIFVSGSDGATIDQNFINPDLAGTGLGAGLDGIHVEDSDLVTVGGLIPLLNGNKIFSTGGDGIHIDGSAGALVLNNMIIGTNIDLLGVTLGGEIGDDGIDLNETVGAVVAGNIITDVDGDGIESSYGLLSAFGLNFITNAGDDGIDVSKSALYLIGGNVIDGAGDNGIRISESGGGLATLNRIDGSEGDGIEVSDSLFVEIYDNDVTDSGDDGIDVDGGFGIDVKKNTVTGTGHNGIEVTDSFGADIIENEVENTDDDGIYVEGSRFADVKGNFILFAGDDGIEIEDSDDADVKFNRVTRPGGHGISVSDSDDVDVFFNHIGHAGNDGIHVDGGEDIDILSNKVDDSGNNGIDVNYADDVLIGWNRVTDSEYDGINARWIYGSNRDGYALRVIGNSVDHSGDDGVDINWAGPVLVGWNWITDSGYGFDDGGDGSDYGNADKYGADGISVRNVNAGEYLSEGTDGEGNYYNYAVNIIGNHVHVTGDDGIEVVDSGATVISGNHVRDAGYGVSHGEGEYYDGGDFYGADGIHVRNVHGSESYNQRAGFDSGDGFREYSVVIENNRVDTTGDDGVQVLFSGDTRIAHNTITDSGNEQGARIFGGDGIHVMNFGSYGDFGDGYGHVEIVDNDVTNSLDDGIEVMGKNLEVLVDTNRVDESGDNGIRLLSLGGYFDGPRGESELLVELTGFNSTVTGNTVDNSGTNGLYVAGPGHNDVIVAGNTMTDNPVGMLFESGRIDLTGDTNTINGGDVGMLFRPAIVGYEYPETKGEGFLRLSGIPVFAPMSLVDNTIGTTVFNGQSTYFVELDNGAFFAPGNPTILDGMHATYNGVNPSATGGRLTQTQFNMIEAGIYHYVDRQDLGLFFFGFVPNNINQKDIFRVIKGFDAPNGGLNVTITGLPLIPGNLGAFFANISPAAGDGEEGTDASDLANLEPAAGEGEEMKCWSDAVNAALGGTTVNFSFGGSAEDLLNGASGCQSGNI